MYISMEGTRSQAGGRTRPRCSGEIISIMRNECDMIINTTTGVGPECPIEQRIAIIPALFAVGL